MFKLEQSIIYVEELCVGNSLLHHHKCSTKLNQLSFIVFIEPVFSANLLDWFNKEIVTYEDVILEFLLIISKVNYEEFVILDPINLI